MIRDHFWLNDERFARLEPLLPTDTRGKPGVDDRRVINGIIHVLKSGCRRAAGRGQGMEDIDPHALGGPSPSC